MDTVRIFDTTLRDGEQSPGFTMNMQEKLEFAAQLVRLGVDVIEAGFPISSPGDFEAVRTIAEQVRGTTIAGLARSLPNDIDRAWEAVQVAESPRIHVFLASSDIHLQHKLKISRDEALEWVKTGVSRAARYCSDVEFSPEDASRSDRDYLCQVVETAIAAGARTINIPDTVGFAQPDEYAELIRLLIERVPNSEKAVFSVHCHNDLGCAVANSLAAVRAGARQVECTINGIGERAGNAALEEIVMALKTRSDYYGAETKLDTTQLYSTSRLLTELTGIAVQPNKAVVGSNAFAHEAGIHQDGVLKHRATYEIMDAKAVGLGSSKLVLGKHSGRHAFATRLKELGFLLSDEDLGRAFVRFKELCDKKKVVGDRDLEAIVADEMRVATEMYRLEHVQVVCGDHDVPTATVKILAPDGTLLCDASTGTGPVDAVYKAINRILTVPNQLTEFSVKSVTEGIDALGEVTIRVQSGDRAFIGRGANTDIIVASARAYMNALNKLAEAVEHQPVSGPVDAAAKAESAAV
ncbi:MAG: 2-isopropylmalate synthase [Thermomicrobiales bacterium]|nr:2-isopropylmalate synthase [Thermomicrobiales bacterium]